MIDLHRRKNSKGFTLLEVLVAMVLLSIGLLGVARLQMFGLQNTGNAYFRTQATGLLNEMVERVHANPAGALNSAYNPPMPACGGPAPFNCIAAPCPTANLARFDMYVVNCGLNGANDGSGADDLLPGGVMAINCSNLVAADCLQYTATVNWLETNDDDADGVANTRAISITFSP